MGNAGERETGPTKVYVFTAGEEEYEATKIKSTATRIHVALDPEEYAMVTAKQGDFLEYASIPEVQSHAERKFRIALRLFTNDPVKAYLIALETLVRGYFGKGTKEEDYFFRGMGSVSSALTDIFTPTELSGMPSEANLLRYKHNLGAFCAADDSFVTERGIATDTDGIEKVVKQQCAAPRLGQYLLEQGYKLIVGHYKNMAADKAH
ncbi:MAG: hypothetical protein AABX34_01385 [Nanoarchaeota archaeon]